MTPQEVERELGVDVALRWGTGYDTELRSFVNVIATPKGGTHVAGFEQALTKTFNEVLRATSRCSRSAEADVIKDDVLEGLTAVVTVRLAEPQFEGQTKEVLGTPAARAHRRARSSRAELKAFLTSTKRAEKAAGQAGPGEGRRRRHDPDRGPPAPGAPSAARTPWSPRALPAKLADCRSDDVERSELFIVEGDSALGTAKLARNSEFQALLPIRGKILNVQKASVGDMLKNAECASIIQVVGAGSGRTFDLDAGPLRPDHLHGRRRLRRRAHPLPAADAVLQVHARPDRPRAGSSPPCRRCTASSSSNPQEGHGQVRLHLLRRRAAAEAGRADQEGRALEGPGPALQGPRRDGRRPAGRDHDGPAAPHAAPDHRRRRRGRRAGLRAADGHRRGAAQGVHRRRRRRRSTATASTPDASTSAGCVPTTSGC